MKRLFQVAAIKISVAALIFLPFYIPQPERLPNVDQPCFQADFLSVC